LDTKIDDELEQMKRKLEARKKRKDRENVHKAEDSNRGHYKKESIGGKKAGLEEYDSPNRKQHGGNRELNVYKYDLNKNVDRHLA